MEQQQSIRIDADDADALQTLADLCAAFVRQGLTFKTYRQAHLWIIEFTGGF